ncbi:hypothetical protein Tco_1016705 [Tanacetum coccineum]|uniref:Uncharacterized protein n=1 Tax=Tanacetum coccineum TaxID=301880 RepID=A0ABQ5FPE0_9ASTR
MIRVPSREGIDFEESSLLLLRMCNISRIILAYAAHKSVTVFQYGRENCFSCMVPKRRRGTCVNLKFIDADQSKPCPSSIKKALMGLKQAPRHDADYVGCKVQYTPSKRTIPVSSILSEKLVDLVLKETSQYCAVLPRKQNKCPLSFAVPKVL